MSRDHFWRLIPRDTDGEVSALPPVMSGRNPRMFDANDSSTYSAFNSQMQDHVPSERNIDPDANE